MKSLLIACTLLIFSGCGKLMLNQFSSKSLPAADQDRWKRCKGIVWHRQCQHSLHVSSCLDRIYSPYMNMSTEQRKAHLKRHGCPPYMVD